ncbi:MAG: ankyrin repeat domain-containing protein [Alphaproteobacteria bacterium]|nr:ankyrin repeat domain-containing protein [Alphaproteobacteria bacterium]
MDARATPDRIADILEILLQHGFRMDVADRRGDELVMMTVQSCPAPVLARLIALGARVNPVNRQNATPLTLALVAGQWDVVRVLVDRGAGVSQEEVDRNFMELPADPVQRDLIRRAVQNGAR